MGKGMRLKEERKQEILNPKDPEVINSISINMLRDGRVNVSGPITDPVLVLDVFSKALHALAVFYSRKIEQTNKIVVPTPGLIVPGR